MGRGEKMQKVDFPIFSIVCIDDYVIVAGGGGGKKYGLKNKIAIFKRDVPPMHRLNNKVQEIETGDDIIENMRVNQQSKLIVGNSEENCVIYRFDSSQPDNVLKEIKRLQTDFATENKCQNDGKFSKNMKWLGCGGEDFVVKVYPVNYTSNNLDIGKPIEFREHTGIINFVDFHPTQNLLISASEDKTCRLFNIDKKIQVQKLQFSENVSQEYYKFQAAYFSSNGDQIYTVQNPMRGVSYMTVWNMEKDVVNQSNTIKLHSHPVTATAMNKNGQFLGIGSGDGAVKIINLQYQDIETNNHKHDMVVKGLDFSQDSKYLISGTPEFDIDLLLNKRKQSLFSMFIKITFLGIILSWLIDYMFYRQE